LPFAVRSLQPWSQRNGRESQPYRCHHGCYDARSAGPMPARDGPAFTVPAEAASG
jgi:hypothetical protein